MTTTPKLGLPQWEGNDTVRRESFNEAFAQIDAMAQKNIVQSNTPPANPVDQDLWIDTSVTPPRLKRYVAASSSWQTIGPITASDVGAVPASAIGSAGGVAPLDSTGKVPTANIPPLNYVPSSSVGQPNGVPSLDNTGKVPATQIPAATTNTLGGVKTSGSNGVAVTTDDPVYQNAARKDQANIFTGNQTAPAFIASGLTGATAASRYVGATTGGPPTSGTFSVGDFVIDRTGTIWICIAAGTPGTWKRVVVTNTPNTELDNGSGVMSINNGAYTIGSNAGTKFWVDTNGNGAFAGSSLKVGGNSVLTDGDVNSRVFCDLQQNVQQNIPNNAWTPLVFQMKNQDNTNSFSGSTFTAPKSGIYVLTGEFAWSGTPPATTYLGLYKNGSFWKRLGTFSTPSGVFAVSFSAVVRLNANDTLQLVVFAPASQYTSGNGDTWMTIVQVA